MFVKRTLPAVCCLLLVWGGALHAQTPTITSVQNESGSNSLCPGGVAFVRGTNLGGTGTTVTVGSKQAYVFNAFSGTALQIQLPVDAPLGATTLKAGASAPFNITLVPYAPGLPVNSPGSLAAAYHYPSQKPVTNAFPASPNEQIAVSATGLGPTKPVFSTGTAPSDSSAKVTTLPTLSVAGKSAKVVDAFLQPGNPGFYAVVFTMRADATAGNQNITVSIGGLTSNTGVLPVATGPVVGSVTNAASFNDPSLPNGAIAQGAVAAIQGINLGPVNISVASNAFQNTTLSGTLVSVTVNGTTVAGLMYYTSSTQVAFLLPSNTPTGTGTITVTYNGQTGPASPIQVTANNLGIFTVTSDGQGVGIVTYPDYSLVSTTKAANCGGVNTTCGAANPGDVLSIWATGLGPITGSDASGAGLGVNLTSVPLTVWLGGVPLKAGYQGRSGCCIGEDQIVFTVPDNTPTGCDVPLSVQINNFISNSVAIPVAPAGSRTCTPADTTFTTANVVQVSSPGTFTYGEIDLRHRDDSPGFDDTFKGQFLRFTVPPASQPFFMSYVDQPPLGTCQIFNNLNGGGNPPINIVAGLDVGPQVTVQGPNGSKNASVSGGQFNTTLSDSGNFLSAGAYTVSAPGGADAPAFKASITIPALPTMTSPPPDAANPFSVTRSNGLTVTWSGGQANGPIQLEGFSATDNTNTNGADFLCSAPAGAGTFTVPPSVLLALPAGNFAQLAFRPFANRVSLTGSGLSVSRLVAWYVYFTPLAFK
jgi:uncharacterized protein (TIGR03437 family)